jgi:hypothetical protein
MFRVNGKLTGTCHEGPQAVGLDQVSMGSSVSRIGIEAEPFIPAPGFWKFYNTVNDSLHIPVGAALLPDASHVEPV